MMLSRKQNNNLFLFNLQHEEFVQQETEILPTLVTKQKAVRQYLFLMFLIAFPIICGITVFIYMTGHRITLILPAQLLTALLTCAYFVAGWYLRDKKLNDEGKIIFGEIIRQESLPAYANIGTIIRIHYGFRTPQNEGLINNVTFSTVRKHLPDGRKYPQAGTPIAVLYANKKNHKLL